MTFSLHAATIPPFQQLLASMAALIAKAEGHCAAEGIAAQELLGASLAPDMLPFAYQVKSTAVHSAGAIEGIRRGVFAPDMTPPPQSFADLTATVSAAREFLAALDPAEIDGFVGKPMRFEIKAWFASYTGDSFLLSFSKPNFYFHAATAYDILRMKGLAIGKVDFLGKLALEKAD